LDVKTLIFFACVVYCSSEREWESYCGLFLFGPPRACYKGYKYHGILASVSLLQAHIRHKASNSFWWVHPVIS